MSKFKKKSGKSSGAISTASLPDIVFMLLFFFMVTTVMRETELKVEFEKPEAEQTTRLEKKSLVDYIYIGPALDKEKYGSDPRIQLDDQIATSALEIRPFIEKGRARRIASGGEKEIEHVITSLKVDEKTKMGIVNRVKLELREVDALKINYSTARKATKN